MRNVVRLLVPALFVVAVCVVPASVAAETAATLNGHWAAPAADPQAAMGVEFDIAQDADGNYYGTMSQPSQNLQGLLLVYVALEDGEVTVAARNDQSLTGRLSDDGNTLTADWNIMNMQFPLTLERSGEARFAEVVPSAAVAEEFTGKWRGNLAGTLLDLSVINHADGTVSAEVVNLSEGGLRVPAATVVAQGRSLSLDLKAVGGSYAGDLNADGSEISGTFSTGASQNTIVFTRSN